MGDPVAQVHQGGQQPVEEHQPVPGTGADRPPARPIGQACLPARLPARPQVQRISPSPDRTLPTGQVPMLATLTRE